jgi:hypothetical protein
MSRNPVQLALPLGLNDSQVRTVNLGAPILDIRGWYNGWNWNQRRAVTPIQNEAMRRGELIRPTVCSICGFTDPSDPLGRGYVFAHLENYADPIGGVLPACKRCHHVLHARFTKPDTWLAIVAEHYRAGAWFTLLTMRPEDMRRPFEEVYPMGLPEVDRSTVSPSE